MRRYLAYRPEEVRRIFCVLDLIAHGADGARPGAFAPHLCCGDWVCVGWEKRVGLRLPSPPLSVLGPYSIFRVLFKRLGN